MSLINQVLREVDQRQGSGAAGSTNAHVQPSSPPRRTRRRPLLAMLVIGVAGAALAGWWLVERSGVAPSSGAQTAMGQPTANPEQRPAVDDAAAAGAPSRSTHSAASPERPASDRADSDQVVEAVPSPPVQTGTENEAAAPTDHAETTAPGDTELAVVAPETGSVLQPGSAEIAAPTTLPSAVSPELSTSQDRQHPSAAVAAAGAPAADSEPADSGRISIRRADRPAQAADPFEEAQRALSRGQTGLAEERLQDLLANQPGNVEARRLLATVMIAGGRRSAAEEILQQGLEQTSAPALAGLLARLLVEQDELDRALTVLEAHAPQLTADINYHLLYAALLRQAGRHAGALAQYQTLTQAAPASAAAWVGLGASHEALGNPDAARVAYQQATRLDPPDLAAFARSRLRALH